MIRCLISMEKINYNDDNIPSSLEYIFFLSLFESNIFVFTVFLSYLSRMYGTNAHIEWSVMLSFVTPFHLGTDREFLLCSVSTMATQHQKLQRSPRIVPGLFASIISLSWFCSNFLDYCLLRLNNRKHVKTWRLFGVDSALRWQT